LPSGIQDLASLERTFFPVCHVVNPSFLESCKESKEMNHSFQQQKQITGLTWLDTNFSTY